jgi:hypothetical protein
MMIFDLPDEGFLLETPTLVASSFDPGDLRDSSLSPNHSELDAVSYGQN